VLGLLGAFLACAPGAGAHSFAPRSGRVLAGLTGGTSIRRYERIVRKHPAVFETFTTWNTPTGWLADPDSSFRARLALHISTSAGYGKRGVISPEGIALGRSDRFLVSLNRNLVRSGRIVYVRLMAEMNGYWNAYAAFNADGSSRGRQSSPRSYIAAWRRTVTILRGGRVGRINRRLRALGLPRLRAGLRSSARLRAPRVAFLWVPQDAGSPDVAANAPGAFWPGSAYVDWVGTDFYASYPNFSLLDQFYSKYAAPTGKPFVLSEWALYGADHPSFVRALFAWVRTHPRVRMLNYYQGFSAAALPDLGRYPASAAVLRHELRSPRYLAYAREYTHPQSKRPKRPRHRGQPRGTPPQSPAPPESPPLPPSPGQPPTPPELCLPLVNLCIPGL